MQKALCWYSLRCDQNSKKLIRLFNVSKPGQSDRLQNLLQHKIAVASACFGDALESRTYSKSTNNTRRPHAASAVAKLTDVVVLPTPPLDEMTGMTTMVTSAGASVTWGPAVARAGVAVGPDGEGAARRAARRGPGSRHFPGRVPVHPGSGSRDPPYLPTVGGRQDLHVL